MLQILILEDSKRRRDAFRKRLRGNNIVIVARPIDAIVALRDQVWDMVFLDHDLSGKRFQPSGLGTGYEVARWLQRNPSCIPPEVFLHSSNADGRANMKDILPTAIEAPLVWRTVKRSWLTGSIRV